MTKIGEIISRMTLPERTLPLVLGNLPEVAEYEDVERQLARMGADDDAPKSEQRQGQIDLQRAKLEELKATILAASEPFLVRALPYDDWVALNDKYASTVPEHQGKHPDFELAAMSACIIDPVMDMEEAAAFKAMLNAGQMNLLWNAITGLNHALGNVPKSLAASVTTRERGEK